MKAIKTVYFGPTNTKPSRIKASAEGVKSKTFTCDELWKPCGGSGSVGNIQIEAAQRFAVASNWSTNLASGELPNGDWVHCFIQDSPFLRGTDLAVAQARVFVDESHPTQPGLVNGTKACSAYHFTLLQNALEQLEGRASSVREKKIQSLEELEKFVVFEVLSDGWWADIFEGDDLQEGREVGPCSFLSELLDKVREDLSEAAKQIVNK